MGISDSGVVMRRILATAPRGHGVVAMKRAAGRQAGESAGCVCGKPPMRDVAGVPAVDAAVGGSGEIRTHALTPAMLYKSMT